MLHQEGALPHACSAAKGGDMLTSGRANKPIVDRLAVIPWVRWYNICHSGRLKKKSRYVMSDGPRKTHALVLLLVITSGK